jgi:hypothetical protein
MSSYIMAKKRAIRSIIDGSSVYKKSIDKYNILWSDVLAEHKELDNIRTDIKDYIIMRTMPKILSNDILSQISIENTTLMECTDEYSNKIRLKKLKNFYNNHFDTLKDERFDKRYELENLDTEYKKAADALLLDYYNMKYNQYTSYKKRVIL